MLETVLRRCIQLIKADANRQRCVPGDEGLPPEAASRAIDEYLAVLDEAEATATRTVIERAREHHDLWPARLGADMAYGSAEMLDWRVHGRRGFSTPRTQAPPRDTQR
nr:hypothetical protein [Brevundimonas naejangsanensis]